MKAIVPESRLRKWLVTLIQSNGEVMIVAGNVGKIDPGQWATIGTQEPTGADTSFDKWNYYCGSVWSFSWAATLGLVISSSQADLTFSLRYCIEHF